MAKSGLGRGLNSLIPQKSDVKTGTIGSVQANNSSLPGSASPANRIISVNTADIEVNSRQPRKKFTDHQLDDLAKSIKTFGILQPLVVKRSEEKGRYELIAGERRLRAAKKAGLKAVPVQVRDVTDQQKLEIALIENIQRENLNPIEMAAAYKQLMEEFDLTQEKVASQLGKPRSSVANTLRLLGLPEEIQLALIDGRLSEGHAKYLIGLDTEAKQMKLFRQIMHNNLSVQDVNREAKRMGGTKSARKKTNYQDADKEFAFREFFGTKIEVRRKGKGGEIAIKFYSDDELAELTKKIKK
jgi:ParB family chromosome partitioning protein